jgi:hypothetical protein
MTEVKRQRIEGFRKVNSKLGIRNSGNQRPDTKRNTLNLDKLAKSRFFRFNVIPAKAGIQ